MTKKKLKITVRQIKNIPVKFVELEKQMIGDITINAVEIEQIIADKDEVVVGLSEVNFEALINAMTADNDVEELMQVILKNDALHEAIVNQLKENELNAQDAAFDRREYE